ncbi:50S ribosomal protein L6 [Acidimicrobium ferrooxidans]|uniref:Large ribosomal subunit protein uL6 n=1 Tax=Acidimicrobium ferrooxidans TaxID=53635 RepID=A0ABS3ASA2_9ACTN|nr:50S ribosomal protein L6 [Acidimicrobium ferrooxidans]
MSRIGKAPVEIPSGVDVSVDGANVTVKGSGGTLEHVMPESIAAAVEGSTITITRTAEERDSRALHGLTRALINNMVLGVSQGFSKELTIVGVGYRAVAKGPQKLELALGFSHPVIIDAPDGITFEVPTTTSIKVSGIDKQLVGQVAANIRKHREPEPYKGKGIRYVDEYVLRKAGKAAK